jgi:hypothetical protein
MISNADLEQARFLADPLADSTIARILGPWQLPTTDSATGHHSANHAGHWEKIEQINRQFTQWQTNQSLADWPEPGTKLPPEITAPLQAYLQAGQSLPDWADVAKIERAETLFMEYGALSCTLLFCSSLPECYVIPDLSAVLHAAGQLEQHTDHRIRSTAAMIFPVMLKGGLCQASGSGVAQILKVRLIHATIRNLILRGDPAQTMGADSGSNIGSDNVRKTSTAIPVEPLTMAGSASLHHTLFTHGWPIERAGLPCNQEELAYTLLTFSYVFLRSMRKLGLGLPAEDELAFLHLWNVVGHILGIRQELMPDNMEDAQALFTLMQIRGRRQTVTPDPRPKLGKALMTSMRKVIPFRILKPFPALMTRYLCGTVNAREIGINTRVSWLSHGLFILLMLCVGSFDKVMRIFLPTFSISRLITRVLGYHFMSQLLLDQTRPLKLPERLLGEVHQTVASWSKDTKTPRWMNKLEEKLTTRHIWNATAQEND